MTNDQLMKAGRGNKFLAEGKSEGEKRNSQHDQPQSDEGWERKQVISDEGKSEGEREKKLST